MTDQATWLERLRAGERRALARLLSYAESQLPAHAEWLSEFFALAGPPEARALRVGITGIPGAGKSTLIDVLGAHWLGLGHRVAVLAVDPSSVVSGGSVLGDKVRMGELGASERAFVRPLPSGGALGGVTLQLDECARLCELAGYDRIVLETVGVGQSEVDVALVCDVLAVVVVPGTGDDIQAVKRGVSEVTDVLVVNKSDVLSETALQALLGLYREGLELVQGRAVPVLACSAASRLGLDGLVTELEAQTTRSRRSRADRREALLRRLFEQTWVRRFWATIGETQNVRHVVEQVRNEGLTLRGGAERLLQLGSRAAARHED